MKLDDLDYVVPPDQAHEWVKEWYRVNPEWIRMRVNPIKLDGSVEDRYFIGERGLLYSVKSKKVGRPESIDLEATKDLIAKLYEEKRASVMESFLQEQQKSYGWVSDWFINHPEWKYIRIKPIKTDGTTAEGFILVTKDIFTTCEQIKPYHRMIGLTGARQSRLFEISTITSRAAQLMN